MRASVRPEVQHFHLAHHPSPGTLAAKMNLPPIVERELRVATRRRATYWSRVLAAVVGIAITLWMLGTLGTLITPPMMGARLFNMLASLTFFCCLFPGVVLTADCLSGEKREGTLGLLFLTDLQGSEIVFSKLTVTSLRAFYAVLALFPMMALPFFLGGITPGEFWRMAAVLVNTLFLSLANGMFVSSVSWRAQRAMLGTAGIVVSLAYVLPEFGGSLAIFSPTTAFSLAYDGAFTMAPASYFGSLLAVQGLSWALLLLASRLLPRSWQEDGARAARAGKAWQKRFGGVSQRAARARILDSRPVEWLARRSQHTGWIWGSLGLAVLAWLAGWWGSGGRWWSPAAIIVAVISLHTVLQFWIAWEAAWRLNEDRRSGALEQLLSTPLTVADIVHGQTLSLERQFGLPVMAVTTLDVALLILARGHFPWRSEEIAGFATLFAGIVAVLLLNAYVLAWVGLWLGLKLPNAGRAALFSLLRIVLLPTGAFMVALYFALVAIGPGTADLLAGGTVIWVLIGGVNAYSFYLDAQKKLHTEFRFRAACVPAERPRESVVVAVLEGELSLLRK